MGRTREAALDGAARAIAKYGCRKATMGDIAMLAGIAKATLYNHFRTRDDVYRALVMAQVESIATRARTAAADGGLAAAIALATQLIGQSAALRRVADDDPALVARLAAITDAPGWRVARDEVAGVLQACGCNPSSAAVELVLRYLSSEFTTPSSDDERHAAATLLAAAVRGDVEEYRATVPLQPSSG